MPSSGCCVSDVKIKANIYFLWKINSWKLWINVIRNRSRLGTRRSWAPTKNVAYRVFCKNNFRESYFESTTKAGMF